MRISCWLISGSYRFLSLYARLIPIRELDADSLESAADSLHRRLVNVESGLFLLRSTFLAN
jgi:hypothetical protein